MTTLRRLFRRLATTLRWGSADADLTREIDAHLQLLEDDFVKTGMTREDARYAARRAFGGVEQAKEQQRDERAFGWLAGWPTDLRLGARMLIKSPGLTVIAVSALAVAIGAGAAYLEFTRDVMHPTLPLANGERLVGIQIWNPERNAAETRVLADFVAWRDAADTIEFFGAARRVDDGVLTNDGRFARARGVEISAAVFRLAPIAPLFGRTLTEDDEQAAAPPVAAIGHDLWLDLFDGDPNVIGHSARVGSVAYTIVGVMPPGFAFPTNKNLWLPLKLHDAPVKRGEGPGIQMFGRLKNGVGAAAAQAQFEGLLHASKSATARAALRADVRPYIDSVLLEDRQSGEFIVFHAANLVFVVLLAICGTNVATLVFARTAMREGEITVRTALGASRGRISAQLFAEALVLSSVAAFVGLLVAQFVGQWATQMFVEAAGQPRPFWWDDSLRVETIAYACALALLVALLVGVVPALKATGATLQGRLREAGAAVSTMRFGGVWTGVMITQVGITVVFLTTVASFGWGALRSRLDYDVIFKRDQFLTARLVKLHQAAGEPARLSQADYRAMADKATSQSGVANVTYVSELPGAIDPRWCGLELAPQAGSEIPLSDSPDLGSSCPRVGPDYFETMGIALVGGRLFSESEIENNHPVAIVDEAFVHTILGGRNALGMMVRERSGDGDSAQPWHEIIGVVQDVTIRQRKGPADAMVYRPATIASASPAQIVMRTHGAAAPIVGSLQSTQSADADVRLVDIKSLDQATAAGETGMRVLLRIVSVVAAVALLLSTAGIYALVSFTLTRRTREIGIRAALGAAPSRIVGSVLTRAVTQIGAGVLAGAVPSSVIMTYGATVSAGMGMARGVSATSVVCALVILVATISCAAPLRRALRIDPTVALRTE